MTDFDTSDWRPVPLRSGPRPTTPVRRIGDPSAHRVSAAPDSAGPELLYRENGIAHVRFRHHAPDATAVALSASGWWRPEDPAGCDLSPVGNGWWSGCFAVPDDWQVSYRFAEHDLAGDPPWWTTDLRDPDCRTVPDAGNPLRHDAFPSGTSSVLRLPAALRSWLSGDDEARPPLPLPLDGPAPLTWWWAAPSPEPVPLLVFTDGATHVRHLGTHRLLHRAVALGALPPVAAVFVDSGPNRSEVLGVPGGQAVWTARTLVPSLRAQGVGGQSVTADPRRTVVIGSSFGGLTALFTVARAPGTVGVAIAQSPSLWRYPHGPFGSALREASHEADVRVRLQAGRYEPPVLPDAQALHESLVAHGVDATCEPRTGGHDWAWWPAAALDATITLLAD